jgi:hypothetical protein
VWSVGADEGNHGGARWLYMPRERKKGGSEWGSAQRAVKEK